MRLVKKYISIFLLVAIMLPLFNVPQAKADYWGSSNIAALQKQLSEEIAKIIHDMLLGMAKNVAIKVVTGKVQNLMSSSQEGAAQFVTNWEEELVSLPQETARNYMNDFFSLTLQGRSGSGYGGSGYTGYLQEQVEKSLDASFPTNNLSEYTDDPANMFAEGSWRGFNAFISNPANNPFGYSMMAADAYQKKIEQEVKKATTQAIAYQGYKARTEDGFVITPGSNLKDLLSKSLETGFDSITSAGSIPEVATAAVTLLITKAVKQGIGNVKSKVQKEVSRKTSNLPGASR